MHTHPAAASSFPPHPFFAATISYIPPRGCLHGTNGSFSLALFLTGCTASFSKPENGKNMLIIWGIFLTFFGFEYGQDMLAKITILGNNLGLLLLFSNHFWDKELDKDVPHIINILLRFFGFKYGIVHPVSGKPSSRIVIPGMDLPGQDGSLDASPFL